MFPDLGAGRRFRRILLLAVLLAGCDADRAAGGTNGTEAGNAIAARVVRPDGAAVAGATGVFRPSEAIDSSTSATWIRATSGGDGVLRAVVPEGSWTLEIRQGDRAARRDFVSASPIDFTDTLRPLRDLSGRVSGLDSGAVVYLPGLARSAVVGAGGAFLFRDVPGGPTPLAAGSETVVLPDSVTNGVLLSARWGAFPPGAALAWIPDLSDSNLAGPGPGIVPDSASLPTLDPVEGKVRGAPLGTSVGSIEPGLLRDTGAFSVAVRARATATGVSGLWLFGWTDPTGSNGVRMGIGGGRLEVRCPGIDTLVDLEDDGDWHWYALTWKEASLSVYVDGSPALVLSVSPPESRSSWNRREAGRGGAVQIAAFLVWNGAAAVEELGR